MTAGWAAVGGVPWTFRLRLTTGPSVTRMPPPASVAAPPGTLKLVIPYHITGGSVPPTAAAICVPPLNAGAVPLPA